MTTHELRIISSIYKLLGEHDSRELQRAADRADLSQHVRAALRNLAREARRSEASQKKSGTGLLSTKLAGRAKGSKRSTHRSQYRTRMIDFLCDKKQFASKQEMLKFLRMAGLSVPSSPKMSREAIARKVVAQAEKSPTERKKLNSAVFHSGGSETKGWLELISGTS